MNRSGAAVLVSLAWCSAMIGGCSSTEEDSRPPSAGTAGGSAAGMSGAGGSAGKGAGGAAGKGGGGAAGEDGAGGDGAAAGDGAADFSEVGVCGHRGEATVNDDEFSGFEEYFLIGDEGFGDDICVVRYDVERTGDAPGDCPDCEWSHSVELSNPSVVLDENGVCANSELGFDAAAIAELDGSRPAYGFVEEFAGHVSVLMKFDESRSLWDAFGTATYDPEDSTLKFERRNGFCNYRP